jgi:hypothetical protein
VGQSCTPGGFRFDPFLHRADCRAVSHWERLTADVHAVLNEARFQATDAIEHAPRAYNVATFRSREVFDIEMPKDRRIVHALSCQQRYSCCCLPLLTMGAMGLCEPCCATRITLTSSCRANPRRGRLRRGMEDTEALDHHHPLYDPMAILRVREHPGSHLRTRLRTVALLMTHAHNPARPIT